MSVAFDHFSFFALRLPVRSISQLIDLINKSLQNPTSEQTNLLLNLLDQKWVAEAIFLASPDLYETWQTSQDKELGKALQKALWRYVLRSYGRSTPYGLFAGVGLGKIDQFNRIEFGQSPWTTVSRLDSLIPLTVSEALTKDVSIRSLLQYRLNNSLYRVGDQYRFSERTGSLHDQKIVLSSLPSTPDLDVLVNYLIERGWATYSELTLLYGITNQPEVIEYINHLIDDQFLISNLTLPVTGAGMTNYLLDRLEQIPSASTLQQQLIQANHSLLDSPIKLANLERVQSTFKALVQNQSVDRTDALVQTDLFFVPTHLELSSATLRHITTQFSRLLPLLQYPTASPLKEFARRFKDRFDRQEIDLLTALDPEVGVGFVSGNLTGFSLLSDLFKDTSSTHSQQVHLQPLRERLYSRYVLENLDEIEITEADLLTLETNNLTHFPPSWYLHGELFTNHFGSAANELSENWRFVLNSTICGSAAYFLGRFCQGHSDLCSEVQQLCSWEQAQYPDDLLAELVHLPTSPLRAGNVVARPVLRNVEIPYLTLAGVSDEHTILLSDIVVSVTDDESVILRHKHSGKRIRPRHSNAHNSWYGDEVYQFLAAVQSAEMPTLAWSWGNFNQLPYLPRLVYRNLIVSPAQWVLRKEYLPAAVTADLIRKQYRLPRYVFLIEGDNKLLLDLDFEPTRQLLVDEVKKQEHILLKEWIGEFYQPWISDGINQYVSELVIPVKTLLTTNDPLKPTLKRRATTRQRIIPPGQDWFYTKVYLNETYADQFLVSVLIPFIRQARKKGWVTNVFFIRYTDPNYHLRIRCQILPNKYGRLVTAWQKALQNDIQTGFVERFQLDTYIRELERYHPELIDDCEHIFAADSQCFLNWLEINTEASEEDRYRLALQSVDTLLTDFSLSINQKVDISRALQKLFFSEHTAVKVLKQKLNRKYRDYYRSFFTYSTLPTALLSERSQIVQPSVNNIRQYFSQLDQTSTYYSLLGSLIHMTLNRIFTAHQRKHEVVIYHFLARHYESLQARLAD
ncbi:lantibiotic dehydratase (plasmid) [Spirosoma sp. SC4-14]|uniref:lantibiotic dehydratase n=1 Tax=Spirosoma sp. SC4-14 TaxID=3128900 RepID=UPI0030CA7A35